MTQSALRCCGALRLGRVVVPNRTPCPVCGGTGELAFDYTAFTRYRPCDYCDGDGYLEKDDENETGTD